MNKHHQASSSPIHHHRPNPSSDSPKKIKLLCSFGGSFLPHPAGGKLGYSGGETRIVSIHRTAGISHLRSRLAELSSSPTLSLKYQLPDSAIDAPLVSVSTDEDVTHMIEEQDRIESEGKLTRLRLFLCDDSGENTMPWSCGFTGLPAVSCGNRSVVHVCPSEFHVKHNGFLANSECRTVNHRIRLCGIQNHQNNACNTGHHRIGGFDGRFCCKCYAGLRPRSNILKCGHVRSHIGRPCYDTHEYTMERRTVKVVEPSSKRTQPLFDIENSKGLPRNRALHQRNGRKLVDQDARIERKIETCLCGETNIRTDLFGYDQVPRGFLGHEKHSFPIKQQCHLPDIFFYNPIPCFGDDVPYYSVQADHEILTQTMSKNPIIGPCDPIGINHNFHDLNLEPSSKESVKRDCMDLGFNRIRPNFGGLQHKDVQTSNSDFANLEASSCSTKHSADLYVHKQSLLSHTEVVPPALHSSQKNDGCFSLELMDVASSNLGTSVKKVTTLGSHDCDDKDSSQEVSGLLCPSATRVSSKPEKDLAGSVENRQTILSGSDLQEKDNAQGYGDGSKIDSIVNKNVKILQTCFSTLELQTINNSDLEEIRTLGTGTYGTVSYGKWKGCDVAIKRIKPSCFSGDAMSEDRLVADFWKEAHILSQLHHPNVVAFYGVVRDEQITNLATVTEYMANGSLKQVLQRKDRTIDRRKRLIIAMDVAFGMEYLHGKNIVHFDLKSHNFLVNMKDPQRPVCKIGDLGLSKAKQKTLVSGGVRGTLPWMAPELLNGKNGLVSEKIDVYSFGIVMWELLTGEEPHGNMRSSEIIGAVINDGIRPEIPHWCDPMWRSLMERCWSSDPDSRPPFSEIAKELRAMAASVNIK